MEEPIALLAVGVILTFYVVVPQGVVALEVEVIVAAIAWPVRAGSLLMLFEGIIARKPSITPVAVCHCYGSREPERGLGMGGWTNTRNRIYVNPHDPNEHRK